MELQNQIYLLIAVFGGLSMLLFVLIVVLSVYVRKTRVLFAHNKTGYANKQFDGADGYGEHEERDRSRGVGGPSGHHGYPMEMHSRMDYHGDLTKTRNDYAHNMRNINSSTNNHQRAYGRGDAEAAGYGGKRAERGGKANPHAVPPDSRQAGVPDAAPFETEVSNIFDMEMDLDEELDDRDSVEERQSGARYLQAPHRAGTLVGSSVAGDHKPPAAGSNHQYGARGQGQNVNGNGGGANRFHNPHAGNKSRKNGGNNSTLVRDEVEGESQSNSYYHPGKDHGPYFNERRMNY